MAIFDLIQKLNKQNQQIVDAVRADKNAEAKKLATSNRDPLVALSDLLRYANLPFTFSLDRNAAIVASKSGSDSYSVAEMSDGERNALLLAAEVLTVPSGTLILIDEPELHLHRSIISSLLTGLFSNRSDCIRVCDFYSRSDASDRESRFKDIACQRLYLPKWESYSLGCRPS